MINNKKIIVVTPAGRKRYMEPLLKYILREKDIIDEYRIWVNTKNKEDIEYFYSLKKEYPGFITLDERFVEEHDCGINFNIHRFFDKCIDMDTIYIRLDDDIVWLQPDFIKSIATFRINNPKPFLVYGTILNNAVIDSIVQKLGLYEDFPFFEYSCMGSVAFNNPQICEQKHYHLISNYLSKLKSPPKLFDKWVLKNYERVSINCISWLGETFERFEGIVGRDEEDWLSCVRPSEITSPNVVYGGAYCVHFAFGPQREYLDKTNMLNQYNKISNYLDIEVENINFTKIKWNELSDITKILIYQILLDNNENNL
jgi:hypothetical protein